MKEVNSLIKKKCLDLLRNKLEEKNYRKPNEIPTKKPYSVQLKQLENKRKHAIKKILRQKSKFYN